VPILGPGDALPYPPTRVLVGGTSGSGKSTLAREVSTLVGLPYIEIDALHHGPGWTVRPEFRSDVEALSEQPGWITEYQYAPARPVLLAHSDLVVYLLLPRALVMGRVVRRTIRRSLRRETLWNGNIEPPLRTLLIRRDHIIRWAWRTHGDGPSRVKEIAETVPHLPVVVLRSPREVQEWIRGPLSDAVT
jgi:adenylate kinase family enzyme